MILTEGNLVCCVFEFGPLIINPREILENVAH